MQPQKSDIKILMLVKFENWVMFDTDILVLFVNVTKHMREGLTKIPDFPQT